MQRHDRRSSSGTWIFAGALFALGIALAAPSQAGEADEWDHRAMRSRHHSHQPSATPRGLEGTTRFGQLQHGAAVPTRTRVPDAIEHVSQRPWEGRSGGPMLDTPLIRSEPAPRAGTVSRNRSGDRGRTGSPGSTLRAGSVR